MPEPSELIRLRTLAGAVDALSACNDIARFADVVRTAARALVGADGVTVVLRDGKQVRYVDEDAIAPLWKGQAFPIAQCVSGLAILGRQTIVIDDIRADPRVPHDLYGETFVRSMAMVPVGRPDPVAAIGAYWKTPRTPTAIEIVTLETMAQAAAAGLAMMDLKGLIAAAAAARVHVGALRPPIAALRAADLPPAQRVQLDALDEAADALETAIGRAAR